MITKTIQIDKEGVYHLTPSYQELADFETEFWLEFAQTKKSVKQTLIYDNSCVKNPVYLRWLNRLGGLDYWLFSGDHSKYIKVKTDQQYSVFQNDISTANNPIRVLFKSATSSLKCKAIQLDRDDIEGLEHLLTSVHIEMLVSYENGVAKWQTVTLKDKSTKLYRAAATKGELTIEIQLPEIQLQNG